MLVGVVDMHLYDAVVALGVIGKEIYLLDLLDDFSKMNINSHSSPSGTARNFKD